MRILIVDQDRGAADRLRAGLRELGWDVIHADGFEPVEPPARSNGFDVLLVDAEHSGAAGFESVRRIRSRGFPGAIILFTSEDTPSDRVRALEAGADDALSKSGSLIELAARIRALVRRSRTNTPGSRVHVADLVWDPIFRTVHRGGTRINLNPKEYALLVLLLEHQGRTVARGQIAGMLWPGTQTPSPGQNRSIDILVRRLRTKLDNPFPERLIHTLHGVGLMLEAPSRRT